MAVALVAGGNDFKLPAMEGMGRIGYLEYARGVVTTFRVVEGGINIGYRSTAFRTPNS